MSFLSDTFHPLVISIFALVNPPIALNEPNLEDICLNLDLPLEIGFWHMPDVCGLYFRHQGAV